MSILWLAHPSAGSAITDSLLDLPAMSSDLVAELKHREDIGLLKLHTDELLCRAESYGACPALVLCASHRGCEWIVEVLEGKKVSGCLLDAHGSIYPVVFSFPVIRLASFGTALIYLVACYARFLDEPVFDDWLGCIRRATTASRIVVEGCREELAEYLSSLSSEILELAGLLLYGSVPGGCVARIPDSVEGVFDQIGRRWLDSLNCLPP